MTDTQEPPPKPRALDTLFELYVKIGGFVGVGLAVATFAATCGLSYGLFRLLHLDHFHSLLLDAFIAAAALVAAFGLAIGVFFTASVFWLPVLVGLIFLALMAHSAIMRLHHLL